MSHLLLLLYSYLPLFLLFQCALATALVNIKLPLMVGDVVNVVSQFAKDNVGNFIEEIKKPALRLIATYLIQVNTKITHVLNLGTSCP